MQVKKQYKGYKSGAGRLAKGVESAQGQKYKDFIDREVNVANRNAFRD